MVILEGKEIEPGKAIKLLRTRTGMSQQELADRVGLSRVTVTNIENMKKDMRVDTFVKLLRELGHRLIIE